MITLSLDIQNCYGIKSFKSTFNFNPDRTVAVYASNGVMKTSFANTFKDISSNKTPSDKIYTSRSPISEIKDEKGLSINPASIFVIDRFNENFSLENVSALLVSDDLKKKYDAIYNSIAVAEDSLFKEIKKLSELNLNIRKELYKAFNDKNIFEIIEEVEETVVNETSPIFGKLEYEEIFNDKTIPFLETAEIKTGAQNYADTFEKILSKTRYLKEAFNHYNAEEVYKSLSKHNFFVAGHSINLYEDEKKPVEIKDAKAFQKIIEEEIESVESDPILLKGFRELDDKFKRNEQLRTLSGHITKKRDIIRELVDVSNFKKHVWISYFIENKTLFQKLSEECKKAKVSMSQILDEVKAEKTMWEEAIGIFNERFNLPITLSIGNREDAILKTKVPDVVCEFNDGGVEGPIKIKHETLIPFLSSGEQRAFYLLNIIFEILVRQKNKTETLFVVDDIADSFDYRNKYAIVQYLKEITEDPLFAQIILTHNFDFFRTLKNRWVASDDNCFIAYKENSETKIKPAGEINNPFVNDWKKSLSDSSKLIASIPFVRNLIEYTAGHNGDYLQLTNLLHIKPTTRTLKIRDVEKIFQASVDPAIKFTSPRINDFVIDVIYSEAKRLSLNSDDANLESKIVLAIAIRLLAEEHMIKEINDPKFVGLIFNHQTYVLFKRYEKINPKPSVNNLKILRKVNLMTPENIHLNSFMYEPILDMSSKELRELYKEALTL